MSFQSLKLSVKGGFFWPTVSSVTAGNGVGCFKDGALRYVTLPDAFRMYPFVRTKEELFSTTISNQYQKQQYRVIINGLYFDVSYAGLFDALNGNDPVPAESTTIEGLVVNKSNKKNPLIAGRSAPSMFFLANYFNQEPSYTFGFGSAPTDVDCALEGCGPIIINKLPYGKVNKYKDGRQGRLIGEPNAENKPFLDQRSNATFKAVAGRSATSGKTVIAHSKKHRILFIIVLQDGVSPGMSINSLRDSLFSLGIENAVFLDGSDSSLLYVDGSPIIDAGSNKDELNTIGIGFK